MATITKRTNKDGTTAYQAKVRIRGYPPQSQTFRRLTDAKRWAAQTETAIRERRHFKTAEAQKHTLNDLVERYIRDVLPGKPKSRDKYEGQLRWWAGEIGDCTLADLTPALIGETRDKLARQPARGGGTRGPSTVVRYLAALSTAFTVAVKEWGWVEDNPVLKVTKPKEPRGRVRFLSDEERDRLLQACEESTNPHLRLVVVLALSTGMRSGEIMSLHWAPPARVEEGQTWGLVLLDQQAIILHNTKNTETRRIPLLGKALELLREHAKVRRIDTPLLFPGRRHPDRPVRLQKPWVAALKKAGIENFRFHDLRHSAASYLAMSGASLAEIAEVLGHKTLAMVKRYAHLSEAHTASVVDRMNRALFGEGDR